MGLFSFLKRFKKKEEVVHDIPFSEVRTWMENWVAKTTQEAQSELLYIVKDMSVAQQGLREQISVLETAELLNPHIPPRVKQIMEGNRERYIAESRKLLELQAPEELEKLLEFCVSAQVALGSFGQASMKGYQILNEFFKNEVKLVAAAVSDVHNSVKKMSAALDTSRIEQLKELQAMLEGIHRSQKRQHELEQEAGKIQGELFQNKEHSTAIGESLETFKQGTVYKQFILLDQSRRSAEDDIKKLEARMFHSFSVIEAAMKKYKHITLDTKSVQEYLISPVGALLEDDELHITSVLLKLRSTIEQGKLELKEKKKEKILAELTTMTAESFRKFKRNHKELSRALHQLKDTLTKADVQGKLQILQEELLSLHQKQKELMVTVTDLEKKIDPKKNQEMMVGFEQKIKEKLTPAFTLISQPSLTHKS